MTKFDRIFFSMMITICAGLLVVMTYFTIQTNQAEQERKAKVVEINTQIVLLLEDVNSAQKFYEDTAYGGGDIDRIAEQQLLASETTNVLLSKIAYQLGLISTLLD